MLEAGTARDRCTTGGLAGNGGTVMCGLVPKSMLSNSFTSWFSGIDLPADPRLMHNHMIDPSYLFWIVFKSPDIYILHTTRRKLTTAIIRISIVNRKW